MKGLQSGTSETALLQAEATHAPPAFPPRPVLLPPDHPDGPFAGLAASLCFSWTKDQKPDTVFQTQLSSTKQRGIITSLQIMSMLLLNTAQDSVGCLHCQCALLNPFSMELKKILTLFQY